MTGFLIFCDSHEGAETKIRTFERVSERRGGGLVIIPDQWLEGNEYQSGDDVEYLERAIRENRQARGRLNLACSRCGNQITIRAEKLSAFIKELDGRGVSRLSLRGLARLHFGN